MSWLFCNLKLGKILKLPSETFENLLYMGCALTNFPVLLRYNALLKKFNYPLMQEAKNNHKHRCKRYKFLSNLIETIKRAIVFKKNKKRSFVVTTQLNHNMFCTSCAFVCFCQS